MRTDTILPHNYKNVNTFIKNFMVIWSEISDKAESGAICGSFFRYFQKLRVPIFSRTYYNVKER